jgi:hypothetical protein
MSLLLAFMELDKLYESRQWLDREALIKNIKNCGKWNYRFAKYSDQQLYRMWERIKDEQEIKLEYSTVAGSYDTCPECGIRLSDGGYCPVCKDGEEDYYAAEHITEWLDSQGNKVSTATASCSTPTQPLARQVASTTSSKSNIVTIVYDCNKHKLRAVADDGTHGYANVAFPNNLRTRDGQQYEVDALIWNGKNYRVSGDIRPI